MSKLAQEMLALRRDAMRRSFLVRPFNHAGPRQSPTYVTSSFARQIAEIEAGRREPVLHVGNLDSRRDITDVRDTVRAYRLLVRARTAAAGLYNVCCGQAYRVRDLLDRADRDVAASRSRSSRIPRRLRPSDNPVIAGD